MYCNYCGKNFEASEGFEEIYRHSHHLVRCQDCSEQQAEEEYDWRNEVGRRGEPAKGKGPARGGPKKIRH